MLMDMIFALFNFVAEQMNNHNNNKDVDVEDEKSIDSCVYSTEPLLHSDSHLFRPDRLPVII